MSDINDFAEFEDDFQYGDWVESKLNTDVFGIVIGGDMHGLIYTVQLAGSNAVVALHGVTLRRIDDADETPQDGDDLITADNVIDFTKARDLRNANPKGAA